jgi:hypothetical protein
VGQKYETRVTFVCPECKERVSTSVAVPEPYWSADRASDMTAEDQTDVLCPNCKTEFSAYAYNNAGSCDITLDDHPEVTIQTELAFYSSPDEDAWVDYSIPDDPNAIFMDSYHHTGDLLADHGGDGGHLVNRMIFSQQVSALEAYLGDTLIRKTMNDNEALLRLLAADSELAKEKFSLVQIASDANFVKSRVRVYLKSILYHNIPKVRALYSIVFDIDLFGILDASDKETLLKAVEYRHDCMHRNGHDKDGKKLEIFTKSYVQKVADLMKSLVRKIQTEINRQNDIVQF